MSYLTAKLYWEDVERQATGRKLLTAVFATGGLFLGLIASLLIAAAQGKLNLSAHITPAMGVATLVSGVIFSIIGYFVAKKVHPHPVW